VRIRFAAVLVACACAVACPAEEPSEPAPTPVGTVSKVVGPSGGTVTSPSGASVEIPADALEKSVSIRISELSGEGPALPPGRSRVSPIFAFEPHGLEFRREVIVTLPHSAGSAEVSMVRAAVGSDFGSIAVFSVTSSTVSAQTTSFSFFAATIEENGAGGAPGDGGTPDGSAGADSSLPDSAPNDASDGGVTVPPSCAASGPGLDDCGPAGDESCCVSLPVPGGTFYRSYDGVTNEGTPSQQFLTQDALATVSAFRLDRFEVTRARYERFVEAWLGGWRPAPGAGKHGHLNGGSGLADVNGGFESGWVSSWESEVPSTQAEWDAVIATCGAWSSVWAAGAEEQANRPADCVGMRSATAFCIWDGGFLPSEAEWNHAAAGGAEQRVYPWSSPPTSAVIDCSYGNVWPPSPGLWCVPFQLDDGRTTAVGRSSPKGDGRYGHADLGGNLAEWTLDYHVPYETPCVDCVNHNVIPPSPAYNATRGGAFDEPVWVGYRLNYPLDPYFEVGFRCARSP
jgi:formylglycine-generating enzyme